MQQSHWTGGTYDLAWDADSALESITYPNGVRTDQTHTTDGKTATITLTGPGANGLDLLELAYDYDDSGLRTDESTTRTTATSSGQTTTTADTKYDWDLRARLAEVTTTTGGGSSNTASANGPSGSVTYGMTGTITALTDGRQLGYDTYAQLTGMTTPTPGGGDPSTTAYTLDPRGNRLTSTTTPPPSNPAGSTAQRIHSYDLANRLVTLTDTTASSGGTPTTTAEVTYTYDGDNLRARATTTTSGAGAAISEEYVWDVLGAVPQLLNDTTHSYVYGVGAAPLAQINTSATTPSPVYLHTDATGNVRTTTDTAGGVTSNPDYDPYGTQTASSMTATTRFGYAGEYTDPTGYIHLRNRYYDPATAQFLTRDPLEDRTRTPYGYTGGNPLQFTDPLGLDWIQDVGDWTAAFGDTVTFGGTRKIREWMGVDDAVNYCSIFYTWGGVGGFFAGLTPVAGGARLSAWAATHAPQVVAAAGAAKNAIQTAKSAAGNTARRVLGAAGTTAARACSFVGSTPILMAEGRRKPIQDLRTGDRVVATDPETGEQRAERVEHVWEHEDIVVDLVIGGEAITTTEDHPFWSHDDHRFKRADELSSGERVRSASGALLAVSGVEAGSQRVARAYNLSVRAIHTFHVGQGEILVHNTCPPMLGANGTQVTSKTLTPPNRSYRVDVENPAPGTRPGQLHLQQGGDKYLYDFGTGEFVGVPPSLARAIAADSAVARAIEKGRAYLGLQ